MAGFNVSNQNKFLETGGLGDRKSMKIDEGSMKSGVQSTTSTGSGLDGAKSFADTLKEAVSSVNELQQSANKGMENLAAGRTENIAEVMAAAEKADIALRMMVQVRNKMIEAYQEVMKMQV